RASTSPCRHDRPTSLGCSFRCRALDFGRLLGEFGLGLEPVLDIVAVFTALLAVELIGSQRDLFLSWLRLVVGSVVHGYLQSVGVAGRARYQWPVSRRN